MQIPELWSRALKRIAAVVILLGAVLGALEYWIEIERVDDAVVRLAQQKAHSFVDRYLDKKAPFSKSAELENDVRQAIIDYFPIVELYDRNQTKQLEVIAEGKEWVEDALTGRRHGFPSDDQPLYHRIDVGHNTFIQVVIPLRSGYFEGVYELDQQTLADIKQDLIRAVLTVILSVFSTGLLLFPLMLGLNGELLRTSKAILSANIELMDVLGSAIAKRDSDTSTHNYRVTLYAIELAREIKLPDEELRSLIAGAFLHDVGKIGIPDAILLKQGKLDEDEFAIMKTHVTLGGHILDKSSWLTSARDVVLNHHEKYAGGGYPRGLAGEQIPLLARVFAIVDVFDALTSVRPYKESMSLEHALEIIRQDAGTHFDPKLAVAFDRIAPVLYHMLNGMTDEAVESLLRDTAAHYYGLHKMEAGSEEGQVSQSNMLQCKTY